MFVSQDFVVSFFVELSVMMLERLYLDPGAKEVHDAEWCVISASINCGAVRSGYTRLLLLPNVIS